MTVRDLILILERADPSAVVITRGEPDDPHDFYEIRSATAGLWDKDAELKGGQSFTPKGPPEPGVPRPRPTSIKVVLI